MKVAFCSPMVGDWKTGHDITRAKSFGNQFPPATAFLDYGS